MKIIMLVTLLALSLSATAQVAPSRAGVWKSDEGKFLMITEDPKPGYMVYIIANLDPRLQEWDAFFALQYPDETFALATTIIGRVAATYRFSFTSGGLLFTFMDKCSAINSFWACSETTVKLSTFYRKVI